MKRKIVNGFLLMAFFVSSVSMFVACKDYDEDVYVDLKSQLAKEKTLRELLQQQVDELEAFAKSIEQCKCNLEAELAEYLKKSEADETYLKKDELEGYLQTVANMQASIQTLQEALDKINATLEGGVVTTDEFNQLIEQNETILHLQELVEEALELAKAAQGCDCDFDEMFAGINGRLDDLEALAAGMPEQIAEILEIATQALDKATANADLIDAQNQTIEELKELIEGLQEQINNLPSGGGSCDCKGSCNGDCCGCSGSGSGEGCSCNLDAIWTKLGELETELNNKATKEQLNNVKTELEENISEAKNLANEAMEKAKANSERIDGLDTKVGELEESLATVIADVEELQGDVKKLKEDVEDLQGRVTDLEKEVKKLTEDVAKLISGIIVQAAESPVVGYLNTPVGLNSTILAVYYGQPVKAWEFPSTISENYVNGDTDFNKWTKRNLEIIGSLSKVSGFISGGANDIIVTGADASGKATEGNAGTLYLTVNPAEADFNGLKLKLVDSQDNEAPATLSALKHSDRQLTFGFTRAENNAFYEAKATIEAADVDKAKMNIDYNAIAADAKGLLQNHTKSDVLELGATLLQNASDIMPAYGAKASWKDPESSIGERTIYSQYNVAATAVKPLSLAFLQDWEGISKVPGLDRLQDIVGRMIDKIRIDLNLPNIGDFDDVTFEEISIDGIDFSKLNVKLTLRLDGDGTIKVVGENNKIYTATIENGQVVKVVRDEDQKEIAFDKSGESYYIEEARIKNELIDGKWFFTCYYYFGNEMEEVMRELADEFNGSIPEDLADLFNELKKLSNVDDAITDTKNNIKEQFNKFITRVNNKLANWINRAPGLLHLTMIANVDSKVGLLSQSKYMPTKVSGTTTLFPTTYSLELLAPTYKKFVAVTDVFNPDGTNADVAKAKAVNGGKNMAEVIEGTTTCEITGESGYIYEITYTAIDYFGKVAIRKYYVKF